MVHKCWFTLRIQILVNFHHIFVSFGKNREIFQENCNFLEEISWSLISCFLVFYQEMCNSTLMGPINGSPVNGTINGKEDKIFQKMSKSLFANFLYDNTLLMGLLMLPEWLKSSCCNFDIF